MSEKNAVLAGRYNLDSRIAAGGVGEVWRGEDLVLGRPVAIKRLRAEYCEHPETLARFRSEARHAAALSHPGIAQVYDYVESGTAGQPFLVMELIDGPSLADIIARGPLAPAHTMDIVAQAAAGLEAAHRAGLVHRDIKPANLLIAPGGQVKITDFGIAHAAGSAPLTKHGSLVGTPAYLAPERVAGQRATPASDLYSLGILAHECLSGTRPYAGTPIETALAHGLRELPELPPSVPPAVASFITELAAKDPAARPATAGAAAGRAAHLRDSLAGSAPTAPVPAGFPLVTGPSAAADRADRTVAAAGLGPALPLGQPGTLADRHPMTLPDLHFGAQPGPAFAPRRWTPGGRRGPWPARRVAIAIAVTSVAAGLVGWLVSGAIGAPTAASGPARPPSASTSQGSSSGKVNVQGSSLVGLPASLVVRQLRNQGLQPVIKFVQPTGQAHIPGTVVYVKPSGQVPAGSSVIVAVVASPGHDHGHGHGQDGNGQGGN